MKRRRYILYFIICSLVAIQPAYPVVSEDQVNQLMGDVAELKKSNNFGFFKTTLASVIKITAFNNLLFLWRQVAPQRLYTTRL